MNSWSESLQNSNEMDITKNRGLFLILVITQFLIQLSSVESFRFRFSPNEKKFDFKRNDPNLESIENLLEQVEISPHCDLGLDNTMIQDSVRPNPLF